MVVKFVTYIDESGDTGIDKIKPFDANGASEWLVISCFLVRVENDTKTLSWVREILSKFKNVQSSHLHFADLISAKKLIACEVISSKDCRFFVVMSNKKNIRKYKNSKLDDGNKSWLYWWMCRLLLERVTDFCDRHVPAEKKGSQKLRIVFSRRGGMRYIDFHNYLQKLYLQSRTGRLVIDTGDIYWPVIDFDEIFVLDHKARAGLQLADVVAGAFFQAVERNRPAECDPIYAKLLRPRMARDRYRRIMGYGIKTMPDLWEMQLALEQRPIFEHCGFLQKGW
ncbi:DUF3800 domain-containing protein [Inquilinus sp. YAF38]|uniref:DUF3800 domain-containing protein n=1 Tax=Inquilinus sp. YAF38 TaxID=3233084 RepID=UPI003F8E2490